MCSSRFDEAPDAGWRTIDGVGDEGDKVGEAEGEEEAEEWNGRAGMMSEESEWGWCVCGEADWWQCLCSSWVV